MRSIFLNTAAMVLTGKTMRADLFFLCFCFSYLLCAPLYSQLPEKLFKRVPVRFNHLQLPGGVEGNNTNCMVQDSLGFLWFGTHAGLHRYDGYRFKTFRYDPNDPHSLSKDYIEALYIDQKGTLWIGVVGGGLNRYDAVTESFQHFRHDPRDPTSISDDLVTAINEDPAGFILAGTFNGLNRMDPVTGRFTRFYHDPEDSTSLSHDIIQSILVDSKKRIWIGTGFPFIAPGQGGLNLFHPDTETFTRYERGPEDPYRLRTNKVRCLFEDSRENIWVGSASDGLHRFDPMSGRFFHYPCDPLTPGGPCQPLLNDRLEAENAVTFINEDRSGILWIGAHNGGVNRFNPENGQLDHFESDPADPFSLSSNRTWSFLESRDGAIWVAASSLNARIDYIDPVQYQMPFYSVETGEEDPLLFVPKILDDPRGYFWLASLHKLYQYDEDWDLIRVFQHEPGADDTMLPGTINVLFRDSGGRIWIGKTTGINRYDPDTGEMTRYQYRPDDPFSLIDNDVTGIEEDYEGDIWVVTIGGVCRLDTATQKFSHYRYSPDLPESINSNFAWSIARGNDRHLWVGTIMGVSRLEPGSGRFKNITLGSATSIWQAPDGKVWIGCQPGRLIRFDPEKWIVEKQYGEAEGFLASGVSGILNDTDNKLWLGTPDGSLVRFDPETEQFENFFLPVQTSQVIRPIHLDKNGRIYCSTPGNLISFHPDSLKLRPRDPVVTITEIDFHLQAGGDGKKDLLKKPVFLTDKLEVNYRYNDFSIFFSAMQFNQASRIRYQYQLQGYDQEWRSGPVANIASYTNLAPGKYSFSVRATDRFGNWTDRVTTLPIVISPPWWRTWWAYLLYSVAAAGLLYLLYLDRFYYRLEKMKARRLQELDLLKTNLYTNITHEFRTPLTIISGMAEQVLEQPEQWFREGLDMIDRNSKKLLYLVNQMLDLNKLEAGKMPLNLEQGDILPYLRYLVTSFRTYAVMKDLRLHFLPGKEKIMMDYDPEKLMNILSNLLSNAIKFTPEGGDIYVQADTAPFPSDFDSQKRTAEVLLLKVRDTGIGIPSGHLQKVFDRFYKVESTGDKEPALTRQGTGVGLAIIQELVKLMNGKVEVKSKEGKGTEFTILLPITTEAPPALSTGPSDIVFRTEAYLPVAGKTVGTDLKEQGSESENKPLALLVDDDPDILTFLQLCLSEVYRTETAVNGQEGWEKSLEIIPEIILSDLMMPQLNGLELCSRLKSDVRTSHIPVVLLTSKTDVESRIAGLSRGADAYLAKPFDQKELLTILHRLLESRRTLREKLLREIGLDEDQSADVIEDAMDLAQENTFVNQLRTIVLDHLDDFDFNVQDLCREVHMSPSQLYRKLSAVTGMSAIRFIRSVRLNRAKELLLDPDRTITSVAMDVGFADPDYFSRIFRTKVGQSPTEFREEKLVE